MDWTKWDKGVELYAEIIKKNPNVANYTRIIPIKSPYTADDEAIAVIISTDKALKDFNSLSMLEILEAINNMDALCSISIYNNKPAIYLY